MKGTAQGWAGYPLCLGIPFLPGHTLPSRPCTTGGLPCSTLVPIGAIPGTALTSRSSPAPPGHSHPGSHPALAEAGRAATDTTAHTHRHARTHTLTQSHRRLNQISGLFPLPRIPAGRHSMRLSQVSGLGGADCLFCRLQFPAQLATSLLTPPHWSWQGWG